MNSKMKGFIGMIALFSFLFSVTTVCAQTRRVKASGTYKTKEVNVRRFGSVEQVSMKLDDFLKYVAEEAKVKINK